MAKQYKKRRSEMIEKFLQENGVPTGKWHRLSDEERANLEKKEAVDKPHVAGAGIFRDPHGRSSINTNVLLRGWRESGSPYKFMLFFAGFWNAIMAFMFFAAGGVRINGRHYESIMQAVEHRPENAFIFIFPLVGLVVLYIALALTLNHTIIKIDLNRILVKKGPLPWGKNLKLPFASIKQCYVEMYVAYQKNHENQYRYRLKALQHNGKSLVVDSGMRHYSDARILEQWIESKIGIDDEMVPGEVGA